MKERLSHDAWQDHSQQQEQQGVMPYTPDFSFSSRVKKIIKGRENNQPQDKHMDFGNRQCSHIDHTKGPGYNDPENGELLNRTQHWILHKMAANGQIDNGLTEEQNQWSANILWSSMTDDERAYLFWLGQQG